MKSIWTIKYKHYYDFGRKLGKEEQNVDNKYFQRSWFPSLLSDVMNMNCHVFMYLTCGMLVLQQLQMTDDNSSITRRCTFQGN